MRTHRAGQGRRSPKRFGLATALGLSALFWVAGVSPATAGDRFARPRYTPVLVESRTFQPTAGVVIVRPAPAVNNYGRLGTFYPTPYIMVRGNFPNGGGYTPLNSFGENTLSLYGPLSGMRMTSAPVLTYNRGYDGRTVLAPGTSFSAPNLPELTPVVYPTQATYYYGFRQSGAPPWWGNAINWLDQN
jgi:hypothetical protein